MNLIRSLMSIFLVVVVGLSIAGWMWAGNPPSPNFNATGARVALALCGLIAAAAMGLLWSAKDYHANEK
jgi:hypothetical protein